jgi:hypothetical protein
MHALARKTAVMRAAFQFQWVIGKSKASIRRDVLILRLLGRSNDWQR